MKASAKPQSDNSPQLDVSSPTSSNVGDEEQGLPPVTHSVPTSVRSITSNTPPDELELSTTSSTGDYLKKKTSQIFNAVNGYRNGQATDTTVAPGIATLVQAYLDSSVAAGIKAEGEQTVQEAHQAGPNAATSNELPDILEETLLLRGRKRASWGTQFRILSGRAFKNLYRDPALLAAHYISSIALAGELFKPDIDHHKLTLPQSFVVCFITT